MKRIFNGFRFAVFFAFNVFLMLVFHSYLNFLIMVGLIALLVYSVYGVFYVRRRLDLSLKLPVGDMQKGTPFNLVINVSNPTLFPVLNATVSLTSGNGFYGESEPHTLTIPLRARDITKAVYPVTMYNCGRLTVSADCISIVDLLGIVELKTKVRQSADCIIMPYGEEDDIRALNIYANGVSEASESKEKGYDFSEISGIREYIPGDKLQNIHWKLSVKRDEMMVKERVSVSAMQLNIVVELSDNENISAEDVLNEADGLIRALVNNNLPFTVYYYSANSDMLVETYIGSEDERIRWMETLLYDHVYKENGKAEELFLQQNPSAESYLYIGFGKDELCTLVG